MNLYQDVTVTIGVVKDDALGPTRLGERGRIMDIDKDGSAYLYLVRFPDSIVEEWFFSDQLK